MERDLRIDVLRGLALVMIFINHVPGTAYEHWTSRNWGLSDAAEGFILLSGVSAGLAYGPAFAPGGDAWQGLGRAWGRAWTLYLVHLFITVGSLGIAAGLAIWADLPALLTMNKMEVAFQQPVAAFAAIPTLLLQLSYVDILPIYIVLLLAAPGLLWIAWRWPLALVAGSVTVWLISGELRLNLPTWPRSDGWFFAPLSWQLLFVVGLLTGLRLRQGRRLVPTSPTLLWGAGALLVLMLLWRLGIVSRPLNRALWQLDQWGAPFALTSFHKAWLPAPRLVHALALGYVLSALPLVRAACRSRAAAPLALLGRHALPVFALATLLAMLLQGIKTATGERPGLDGVMLASGVLLLLTLAVLRDRWPRRSRSA
jgi:hypothetical protein